MCHHHHPTLTSSTATVLEAGCISSARMETSQYLPHATPHIGLGHTHSWPPGHGNYVIVSF